MTQDDQKALGALVGSLYLMALVLWAMVGS
jgi:hypothetical protein